LTFSIDEATVFEPSHIGGGHIGAIAKVRKHPYKKARKMAVRVKGH